MDVYQRNLVGLLVLCGVLSLWQARRSSSTAQTEQTITASRASQKSFFVVYALVMGADWLQGPFLYSLYTKEHGISPNLVSVLFASGFVSGAISGSFVGSLADRRGRKAACLAFCIFYAASCMCTITPSVPLLFFGRALGGIGTSLLFSVFESWMVADFHARKLAHHGGDLGKAFGRMSTINSLVAIVSGIGSEELVSRAGTRKAPFVASAALLVVAGLLIWLQWAENYGETGIVKPQTKDAKEFAKAGSGLRQLLMNPKILSLGLASTTFEGSMYLFVFFWSPALQSAKSSTGELPYGIIFASFMAAMLASSLLLGLVTSTGRFRYTSLLLAILATAGGCFMLLTWPATEQSTFWLFCLFEATVGMYWPCMGYLKGRLIEDGIRAQVYSTLRVPLNIFVVFSLLFTGDSVSFSKVFSACSALLLAATGVLWATIWTDEAP